MSFSGIRAACSMFGRGSFIAMLLAGAFLPYLLSSGSGVRETVMRPFQSSAGASDKGGGAAATTNAPPSADPHASALYATHAAAAGAPLTPKAASISDERLIPFENALQWRITPTWVLTTWPRVTTQLSELELQGYRVTLVTGTTPTDLAGVLTYYFDAKQVLQRITFNGTTGDARRLVQFLASAHRFERRLLEDPSVYLYQVEQDRRALSELKIKTAPIVRAGGELSRFEVALVMRRPEE